MNEDNKTANRPPREGRIVSANAPHGSFKFTQRVTSAPLQYEEIPEQKYLAQPKRHKQESTTRNA